MLQQLVSLDCLCYSQLILLKIDTESKTCDGKGTQYLNANQFVCFES